MVVVVAAGGFSIRLVPSQGFANLAGKQPGDVIDVSSLLLVDGFSVNDRMNRATARRSIANAVIVIGGLSGRETEQSEDGFRFISLDKNDNIGGSTER
ncbi:MAG: hypothetical protein ABEN55_07285 [Bradymonadaceae bacterium]